MSMNKIVAIVVSLFLFSGVWVSFTSQNAEANRGSWKMGASIPVGVEGYGAVAVNGVH